MPTPMARYDPTTHDRPMTAAGDRDRDKGGGRSAVPGRRRRRLAGLAMLLSLQAGPLRAQTADGPSPRETAAGDHEIIVTAHVGEALVEAETELTESDIDAYGASTIGELVSRIAPLTGRVDEQPVVLVNGKRVDGVGGVNGFPPEALARLAILRPEAAARYGYPPGRRVVNLVLKRSFASWQAEAGFGMATAGGRAGARGSLGRFVIAGDTRWNAQVQASHDDALRQDERDGSADARARTLMPAADAMSLNLTAARPLGGFLGTLTLDASRRSLRQSLGPGPESGADSVRVLRGTRATDNIGLSAMIAGSVAGWNGNLILRYGRSWSDGAIERIAGASISAETTRARSESLAMQLNLNRVIATLPAGPATANLTAGAMRNRSANGRSGEAASLPPENRFRQRQADLQLSLGLPLSSAAGGPLPLGDLSLDLATGIGTASGSAIRKRYDIGANWRPFAALDIRAAFGFAELAPTPEQVGGAYVEEIRRVYDIRRDEAVDALWITGGNPDLGRGSQRIYSIRAALRPFGPALLTLTSEYRRQAASGGAAAFPALTPAVEDGFPGRVRRDASGRLLSVDARPIAIARDLDERLDSSLVLAFAPRARAEGDAAARSRPRWQATLAVTHGLLLKSELLTRPGLPPLDRIDGDIAQSRHVLGFQLVAGRPGLGITFDGSWQSPFRQRNPGIADGLGDYRYRGFILGNLRLHAEPEKLLAGGQASAWPANLQISLDIRNLFDTYRKARLADGSRPPGYRRYAIDPLGRSVQLSLRKRF